eukprot:2036560-Prymnesium_polylepis.1
MIVVQPAELAALRSDIRELHARGNERRASLGHPLAQDVEPALDRHKGSAKDATSPLRLTAHSLNQLSHLRDLKASELQALSLRAVGRSSGGSVKAAAGGEPPKGWSGSRFNVRTLIATVDALIEQHDEVQQQAKTNRALQRENRALIEESGLLRHALSEQGGARRASTPAALQQGGGGG